MDMYYSLETTMANRFKRHLKTKKYNEKNLYKQVKDGSDIIWNVVVDGEHIEVLRNNAPNCVSAVAGLLRTVRYNIKDSKISDNYLSYVSISPLCSIDNSLNGYKVAKQVYMIDLPVYFIFTGKACF